MVVVLTVVVLILGKEVWDVYKRERLARESLELARVQQEDLNRREEFLSSEIELLNDTEGVEGELRQRFGIAKPGEKVIVLVDEEATTTSPPPELSFWKKILSWFW